MKIRDRIKELRRVRAGDLSPNPRNWRTHPQGQVDALRGVIAEVGYADALLARELPDGTLELIDGHARQSLDPDQEVPVLVLDLDQDEALKLMTVLDPLAAMAEANESALETLLAEIDTDSEAVQAMLDELAHDNDILSPGVSPVVLDDDTPQTVRDNIEEMERIKSQRKKGNDNFANKNDTERYLVIVYGSRGEKEQALVGMGLDADERYLAASACRLSLVKHVPVRTEDGARAISPSNSKSGATGIR